MGCFRFAALKILTPELNAVAAAVSTDVALQSLTAHIVIITIAAPVGLALISSAHAHHLSISTAVFDIARLHICCCANFVDSIIVPSLFIREHA